MSESPRIPSPLAQASPRTRAVLKSAVEQQRRAVDALLMPPPPPLSESRATEKEKGKDKNKEKDKENKTAPKKPLQTATTTTTTTKETEKPAPKRKSLLSPSPSTPRPFNIAQHVNQLSRTAKPKPFQQKLTEATSTPPPKSFKSASKYGTPVTKEKDVHELCKLELVKLDQEMMALKQELDVEKTKVLDLERQLNSRNLFIGKIESVAKTTADKLAANQKMLMSHVQESKNHQIECVALKAQLAQTIGFLPASMKKTVSDLLDESFLTPQLADQLEDLHITETIAKASI